MKRLMRLLPAVATLIALIAIPTPAMAATTRWVNDNDPNGGTYSPPGTSCMDPGYATINAAVAAAGSGDTIQVCDGTYNESVTIGQPLSVLGPNATIPWNGSRQPEAVVNSLATTFNVTNGQDVRIAGFTITGAFGVFVSGSTTNTTIENNIITGTARALSLEPSGSNTAVLGNHLVSNTRSMHLSGSGPYTNLTVNGNRFSGTGSPGIQFIANIPISGFEFEDNEVFVYANIASDITGGTVSGNSFNAPPGLVLDLQIMLQNSTMTDNVFEGDDTTACFQLFGTQFSPGDPSRHVTISDNTFSDCGGAVAPFNYAIQLSQDVHHIYIKNNEIADGFEGVNTRDAPPPWSVAGLEIHINYNNITNNTSFGVRNGQMGVLDAECNWWGAADGPGPVGPGSGDNVSTNVDYTPWLIARAPGGACVGGVPSTPGKVTGGGQVEGDPVFSPLGVLISLPAIVLSPNGSRASFGFVIQLAPGASAPKGNLMYQDQDAGVRIKATSYDQLIIGPGLCGPNTHATFTGMADVNGVSETLTVEVDDCGEPSSGPPPDMFKIDTESYSNGGPQPLIGGNIQIH
jgi:parallel beta-helix repeat protein